MRGDFTRWTFNRNKRYSGVLNQQGRVALDADWNEQIAIELDDTRAGRADTIGLCGGPRDMAGFAVEPAGATLNITAGRYYVAGIRVELAQTVAITAQPDLPVTSLAQVAGLPADATMPTGVYLAYLDVWERHLTALEDPALREVALGGPDTTTRLQVMAQVKLLRLGDVGTPLNCATANAAWDALLAGSSGQLEARAEPSDPALSPCVVPAQAGYRGLENQLYRVEVHRVVSPTRIALKWSRDNGSIVVGWSGQDPLNPNRLIVASTGRDDVLGLAPNQWVELSDENRERRGEAGVLVRITQVEGDVVTIDPDGQTIAYNAFGPNPTLRRWDTPASVSNGELIVTTGATTWSELEHGVQIRLKAGSFRPGDYWLIPARTITNDIEWPRDTGGQPVPQPPHGIRHHYCKLALLEFDNGGWSRRSDCRRLFPPLTELIHMYGVGGDGQEAMPGARLSRPLQVAVTNGQHPVNNARVRFQIVPDTAAGQLFAGSAAGKSVDVTVGEQGVYSCQWQLGPTIQSQRVAAFLVEIDGKPLIDSSGEPLLPRVFFNANLSRASHVAYEPGACPDLSTARTVQEALDLLCQRPRGGGCCVTIGETGAFPTPDIAIKELLGRGERRICLCLLPGEHRFGGLRLDPSSADRPLHIEIKSCGATATLQINAPVFFQGVNRIALRDLAINVTFIPDNAEAALAFTQCPQVVISGCAISGMAAAGRRERETFRPGGALITISDGDDVRIAQNMIAAAAPMRTFGPIRDLFQKMELTALADLFRDETALAIEWQQEALRAAESLAQLNREQRQSLARRIQEMIAEQPFTIVEMLQFTKLTLALNSETLSAATLLALLIDLRAAAIKSRPGTALVLHQRRAFSENDLASFVDLLDEDDMIALEQNRIAGEVSLYGMPAPLEMSGPLASELIKFRRRETGSRLGVNTALLGSVHFRSNHLARITIGFALLTELQQLVSGGEMVNLSSDICARLLFDGNIFEGFANLTVSRHLIMHANEFSAVAVPQGRSSPTTGAVAPILGWHLSDVAGYVGNHGANQSARLIAISRLLEQVANLQLQLS